MRRTRGADEQAFAERTANDRHHFRFIISPDQAAPASPRGRASGAAFLDRPANLSVHHEARAQRGGPAPDHGRTHHLRFSDLELTGDARPGAIVEARVYDDANGRQRLSLATRSDLTIEAQISAPGATWIDRQLLAKDPSLSSGGFGAEVREAMDRRIDHLAQQSMAERQGQRVVFARVLLNTLRRQEIDRAVSKLSAETGLAHRPSAEGEHVSGIYRQRVTLSSGRFAMIDDGMGFQLVPWRPALEQQLGKQVAGVMAPGGSVDWNFGRKRGLGL